MIRRKLFYKLQEHLSKKEFSIITGARQTGKTTLLKQLAEHCQLKGDSNVFLNLENRSILADLDENPLNLLKYLPESNRRVVVFIDEIQYLGDPSHFLKLIFDDHHQKIKIVATGSSAFYMDDRFRDSLDGRKRVFQLFTCSFRQYL